MLILEGKIFHFRTSFKSKNKKMAAEPTAAWGNKFCRSLTYASYIYSSLAFLSVLN
jgi:hypothetical protein